MAAKGTQLSVTLWGQIQYLYKIPNFLADGMQSEIFRRYNPSMRYAKNWLLRSIYLKMENAAIGKRAV